MLFLGSGELESANLKAVAGTFFRDGFRHWLA
jgi:hypothetical protein